MASEDPGNYRLIYPASWSCGVVPLSPQDIVVDFSTAYNRRSTPEVDSLIEMRIAELCARKPSLYPGAKFRFDSVTLAGTLLTLCIGLTDYLEYLVTNYDAEFNEQLIQRGLTECRSPDVYLSNAIGNLAVTLTADGKFPLLLRSSRVSTFQGQYDFTAGHPEPGALKSGAHAAAFSSSRIRAELFEGMLREIEEELNVKPEHIASIRLLGLVHNLEDGRKPEMIFYAPLDVTSDELVRMYAARGVESNESVALIFLDTEASIPSSAKVGANSRAAIDMFRHMVREA
jgi:8-oxo-dGTP pyrophosphatase MutT (NUDIX family)